MLEQFFGVQKNGSTIRTEIMAGIITFFATAYIILVNPLVLSKDDPTIFNGVFFATCLGAAVGTLLMAFYARLPFAQAPGMGLNAFFSFTAAPAIAAYLAPLELTKIQMYQMTLPLVLYSGILFVIISAIGLREKIINGIPENIKRALTSGVGLFITYLGLKISGIVVAHADTQISLLNFADYANNKRAITGALLTLIGVFVITALASMKIRGAVLFGILIATLLAFLSGYSTIPDNFSFDISKQAGDFLDVSFLRLDFTTPLTHGHLGTAVGTLLALILAFFMVNMFDSMATIYGVCQSAGMVEANGEVKGLRKGLMADAMGTVAGALLGTSTVTTVVESATGIGEGGRTGLASLVTGLLFLAAIILAPIMILIPGVATAPALIYVGFLMLGSIKSVSFSDPTEGVPAFLTIIMMPLTFSIANGIAFGLISYVVIKLITGRAREIKLPAAIVAALFVLQFILR